MGRNGVLGVIVPIHEEEVMHDIFHGKSIHASLAQDESTDLQEGDRILFYDSGKTHSLRGEAVISEIDLAKAKDVLLDFGGKLCMGRGDFERYVASLPKGEESKLRVLHFKDPILYADPVKCNLAIPEGGTYMTAELFSRIAKGGV